MSSSVCADLQKAAAYSLSSDTTEYLQAQQLAWLHERLAKLIFMIPSLGLSKGTWSSGQVLTCQALPASQAVCGWLKLSQGMAGAEARRTDTCRC